MIHSNRKLLFAGSIILCAVAWLCLAAFADRAVRLTPPIDPIPKTLFGMHIHYMLPPDMRQHRGAAQATPWPPIPFGTWRLWDSYVPWPWVEPEKGKWDFANLDKYVSLAEQNGVNVLLPLGISPTWASARPTEKAGDGYSAGSAAEPGDLNDWRNYVRTVATRYKGRVHTYEIWNEPNAKNFWSGSVPKLVEVACAAYSTLKAVDPTIEVTSPPATTVSGVEYFDQYLRAGGGKCADIIGYHLYVSPRDPETMVPLIQQLKQIMSRNGVSNKPLWNTETGWPIQNKQSVVKPVPGNGYQSVVLPEDEAASYVARSYILAWASGVSRFYWYSWDHPTMGLVDRDGKTLKSPAIAYGEIQKWLIGARMDSCDTDMNGTWTCAISRGGGYRGWILWNPDGRRTFNFPIPPQWGVTRLINLWGHDFKLAPGASVEVTVMPNLLEASGR